MTMNLHSEEILKRVSELDIFRFYIGQDILLNRTMLSPLRGENRASFNLYQTRKGRIRFKDFAGEEGSVFDFIMLLFNCDYETALKKICVDMNLAEIEEDLNLQRKVMI